MKPVKGILGTLLLTIGATVTIFIVMVATLIKTTINLFRGN